MTFFVGLLYCVPPCVVCDTFFDIYCLTSVTVEYDSGCVRGDFRCIDLLLILVDLGLCHCYAGPIAAVRPVVYVYIAVVLSVCKEYCDSFNGGGLTCGLCCLGLSGLYCCRLLGLALCCYINAVVEPVFAALSVGSEVYVVYVGLCDLAVLAVVVTHSFGIPCCGFLAVL